MITIIDGEVMNIKGFVSIPINYYQNRNFENTDNIKRFFTDYKFLVKSIEKFKRNDLVDYVTLDIDDLDSFSHDHDPNKITIFEFLDSSEEITEKTYIDLLEKIIPSVEQIIHHSKDKNKIYNNQNISNSFFKYDITLQNSEFQDFKFLKNLLQTNIKNYQKSILPQQKKFKEFYQNYSNNLKSYKKILKKRKPDLITNQNLQWDLVTQCYGEYNFTEYLPDNDIFRLQWLDKQIDYGKLYYYQTLLENIKINSDLNTKSNVDRQIKTIQSIIQSKKILKDKKLSEYNKIKQNNQSLTKKCKNFNIGISKIYYTLDDVNNDNHKTLFYDKDLDDTPFHIKNEIDSDNNLEDLDLSIEIPKKLESLFSTLTPTQINNITQNILDNGKKVQIGDYALLNDYEKKYFKRELDGANKEIWVLTQDTNIQFKKNFCINQGENIQNTKRSDLTNPNSCNYNEIYGCLPNKLNRLLLIIKNLNQEITKLELMESSLKKIKDFTPNITKDLDKLLLQNKRLQLVEQQKIDKIKQDYEKLTESISESNQKKSPLFKVLKKIMKQRDIIKRNKILSSLITNDNYVRLNTGDEDTNWLYTTDTNEPFISKHWLLKVQLSDTSKSTSEISTIIDKLKEYGIYDQGSGKIVSKIDGDELMDIDYEFFEGFEKDDSGFKNTRSLLTNNTNFKVEIQNKEIKKYKEGEKDYHINMILKKLINLLLIEINLEIQTDLVNEINYELNPKILLSKANWQTKHPKKNYDKYRNQTILFFTSAYLIIFLQTSNDYKRNGVYEGCVFSTKGYPLDENDDETKLNSLNYLSCVLDKLKNGISPWDSLKKISKRSIRKNLKNIIQKIYTNNLVVKKKYQTKRIKIEESNKQINTIDNHFMVWKTFKPNLSGSYSMKEPPIINESDKRKIIQSIENKNYNQFIQLISKINLRIRWLCFSIIDSINIQISNDEIQYKNILQIPLQQNACCLTQIDEFSYYLKYFINDSNDLLNKTEEIKQLEKLKNIYINNQTIPSHIVNKFPFQITKSDFNIVPNTISKSNIYALFLKFSNENHTFGQERLFNKFGRDIVSGQKLDFCKKKNYSEDDYKIFINKFYQKNIINYSTKTFINLYSNLIQKLKEDYPFIFKTNKDPLLQLNEFNIDEQINPKKDGFETLIYNLKETIETETQSLVTQLEDNTNHSIDDEKKKKIIKQLNELGDFTNILEEQKIRSRTIQSKDHAKINFYKSKIINIKNYIHKFILSGLSKIIRKNNKAPPSIPDSWGISEKHKDYVLIDILKNRDYLISASNTLNSGNNDKEKHIISEILNQLLNIDSVLNNFIGKNKIKNCEDEIIYDIYYNSELCSQILHYILLRILHFIINQDFIQKILNDEPIDEIKTDLIIENDEDSEELDLSIESNPIDLENEFEILPIQKKTLLLLSNYIVNSLETFENNIKSLDLTENQITISFIKSREDEKTQFYKKDQSIESREIDQQLKQLKLGSWSKGLSSSVYKYSMDDYDDFNGSDELETLVEETTMMQFGETNPEQLEQIQEQMHNELIYQNEIELDTQVDQNYDEGGIVFNPTDDSGLLTTSIWESKDFYQNERENYDYNLLLKERADREFGKNNYSDDQFIIYKQEQINDKRINHESDLDNFVMQEVSEDSTYIPANLISPSFSSNLQLKDELVELSGGITYGQLPQNIDNEGSGNDGTGAHTSMALV